MFGSSVSVQTCCNRRCSNELEREAKAAVWLPEVAERRGGETNGVANYDIVPVGKLWGVQHDGKVNGKYLTKESAFELAAAAASMAIHQGHEVHISVPSGEESGAASKAF
jgi:hypothetical protein